MRDHVLPEAQAQLDEIAAAMASALSDRTIAGPRCVGAQAGFDIDIAGCSPGNTINLTYTDIATAPAARITIVRVDDPSALPLPATRHADPDDRVVGVDFSGGMASVVAQLNSALGATFLQFSNPAGNDACGCSTTAPANKINVDAPRPRRP